MSILIKHRISSGLIRVKFASGWFGAMSTCYQCEPDDVMSLNGNMRGLRSNLRSETLEQYRSFLLAYSVLSETASTTICSRQHGDDVGDNSLDPLWPLAVISRNDWSIGVLVQPLKQLPIHDLHDPLPVFGGDPVVKPKPVREPAPEAVQEGLECVPRHGFFAEKPVLLLRLLSLATFESVCGKIQGHSGPNRLPLPSQRVSAHCQVAVCINLECDLNFGDAARTRWEIRELELGNPAVVPGHGAFATENADDRSGLVVGNSGEDLGLTDGIECISR
ncbi:hypothetical protein BC938DRAFT_473146 [Jimgerdemannia flammicorona]|uniref:Uncharacterized protein n=1 Tax=Jimgerdemannia flammicorona TaxID=994334 RepID=A0A433Q4M3_9FUNG|nr:hypothetical protein BC938DRAFT_473146 [Jimgerdemannia flammicorona]